ncbi:MAG: RNA-binding protein [Acidobacteria bacterium]|nr:RNA-binding protein [Acidobacteriota bacterium]
MSKRVYVGNLAFSATEQDVRAAFEAHGSVESVHLVSDRDTGQMRGFGFVEFNDAGEAQRAIDALNGQDMDGRALVVNEARPRPERTGGGGGYGGGGGRGRGGYGGGGGGNRW